MHRMALIGLTLGAAMAPLAAQTTDSAAVVATIETFRAALASGDSSAALRLLATDATILESGGSETVEQYRSHHLPADIAFAQSVPHTRGPIRVTLSGDVAWAASTSAAKGEFRGREVNSASAELIVLRRSGAAWRIVAIHWSSRTRR